jgi:hypothetical protein
VLCCQVLSCLVCLVLLRCSWPGPSLGFWSWSCRNLFLVFLVAWPWLVFLARFWSCFNVWLFCVLLYSVVMALFSSYPCDCLVVLPLLCLCLVLFPMPRLSFFQLSLSSTFFFSNVFVVSCCNVYCLVFMSSTKSD